MEAGAAEAGAAAAAPANSGAARPRRNRSKHAARAAEDAVTSQGGDAGTFMLWLADRARGNPRRKAQLSRFQNQAGRREVKPPTLGLIEALAEECPSVGVGAAEAWIHAYGAARGAEEPNEQPQGGEEHCSCGVRTTHMCICYTQCTVLSDSASQPARL